MQISPKRKRLRNQPEIYNQVKQSVSIGLTPWAIEQLDMIAQQVDLSRSELIERIARGFVQIHSDHDSSDPEPPKGVISVYYPNLLPADFNKRLKVFIHRDCSISQSEKDSL